MSHYQGAISWGQVKGSGHAFALAKATEDAARRFLTRALVWSASLFILSGGLYLFLLVGRVLQTGTPP